MILIFLCPSLPQFLHLHQHVKPFLYFLFLHHDLHTSSLYLFSLYDIKPVNEPRRLVDDLIAVGCKVKRGKDWRYGDKDGGRGSRGTVLRVDANGEIVVSWDRGRLGSYKFAADGVFEVEVCEHGRRLNSPDLIEHQKGTETTSELPDVPLILPATKEKSKKPVTSTWQYQDKSEQLVSSS